MILEAATLAVGLTLNFKQPDVSMVSDLNIEGAITLSVDDLFVRFENRYRLEGFNSEAMGFIPKTGEYTVKVEKVFSAKEFSRLIIGYEHGCFHVIDRVPTVENVDYGVINKLYLMEVK